jgi:hypothetical protein
VVEPPEDFEDFSDPVGEFRTTYPQLFFDSDKNCPFEMHLLDIRLRLGQVTVSAGFSWPVVGMLVRGGGKKFCAVNSLFIRELFRGCGISSLLKLAEIDLAESQQCNFIQTWHESDNPYFVSAIVPSLKTGFVLFHGTSNGGEVYEDNGRVHLRKYLDGKHRFSKVSLENGGKETELISPDQNESIICHFAGLAGSKHPGKSISSISRLKDF